jgi:beta-glucosidase
MTDETATAKDRASTLVAGMTLEEKASLCSGENFWALKSIERLGLPAITVTDGPHGLRKQREGDDHLGLTNSVPATCFPSLTALGSSWDRQLARRVGEALGEECAAENVAVLLGPGINMKRHPLCGRNFEYFSEDPLLTGNLAAAMINGIQSRGVGACVKHFAAYNQETHRMIVDVVVDQRTLREIYLRAFELAVEDSAPWALMSSYNRINGCYSSEHAWLLGDVLRGEWGYRGMVVSDWMGTNDRVQGVTAGLDLEMPGSGGFNDARIVADLDEHHALARTAATRSAVLLKNDGDALPLRAGQRIAVIGALARSPRFQGSGSAHVNAARTDNSLEVLQAWAETTADAGTRLTFDGGYDPVHSAGDRALIQAACDSAQEADVAVVFVGLPESQDTEIADRASLALPDQHNHLVQAVAATGTPTVAVLLNGAPVTIPWVNDVAAVLEAYPAGQASGSAVADLLVGRANPCGKLAETLPLAQEDVLSDGYFPGDAVRQVQYREGIYIGYRYFNSVDAEVLFPFGHGLSYTRFDYSGATLSAAEPIGPEPLRVSVTVTNSGQRDGEEVVQVYVKTVSSQAHRPVQQLAGFDKVTIAAEESAEVIIALDHRAFAWYDTEAGSWRPNGGDYLVQVGSSSRAIHAELPVSIPAASPRQETLEDRFFKSLRADQRVIPDDVFERMLGRAIPDPEPSLPFTANSILAEPEQTRLGRRVSRAFLNKMLESANIDPEDTALQKIVREAMRGTPLRAMALASGGQFSFKALEIMIHLLNLRPLRAAATLLRR